MCPLFRVSFFGSSTYSVHVSVLRHDRSGGKERRREEGERGGKEGGGGQGERRGTSAQTRGTERGRGREGRRDCDG